jgi:hypothetical protein
MKTIKHYVDKNGNSLGDFEGSVPKNGIEVPVRPNTGLDIWNGESWDAAKPTQDQYMQKAQSVMDAQAQSMGYDNIFTAISYIGDPFPRFNDEAVALRAYRSRVWQHSNDLMAQVLAGKVAQPSLEEYEQGLPDFTL